MIGVNAKVTFAEIIHRGAGGFKLSVHAALKAPGFLLTLKEE